LVVPQHRRSFVFKVLIKELSIRGIMIRWLYPFPWYNAWESYAYASGAIQPAGAGAAGELLAQVRSEVVAILGEEIVGCAEELLRSLVRSAWLIGGDEMDPYLFYDCVELFLWSK
jgi:hypothetical protein